MSDGRHGKDETTSIVAWLQAKVERLTADRDRLSEHIAERERLDQMTFAADLPAAAGDQTGPLPAVPPQRSRHGGRDRTHLRLVRMFLPAALGGGGALRGALAAHHAAVTAAAVTTAGGVLAVTAAVVTMQPAHSSPHPVVPASALGPAWQTSATPILFPSRAVKPKADAVKAAPAVDFPVDGPPSLPAPSVTASAPPSSPSASQVVQGVLDVTQSALTLRPGILLGELVARLDLTATGGPVTWTANAPGLSLDSSGGTLASGDTVEVTVTVPIGQLGGSGTITLEPGNITVTVLWLAGMPGALPSSLGL